MKNFTLEYPDEKPMGTKWSLTEMPDRSLNIIFKDI